ncbi:hypothetical protein BOH66_12915 [Microbacterium aurum]|uniref:D-inositol 3-phosphate glycosyltransferase n=1 Tax=Microbacterium aurum TaxID=36805 RepID=A0A1P8UCV7_9MICO|nr:glycosyltransferase family 4 protein [Microbacterium aurum]APZ35899.1 hypothetical protein BOH66_12915 [Microbacterium aurum]MBM7828994.1 glycosyltransferase involved in cell wall biosynthesis [Microbacterium aurum]
MRIAFIVNNYPPRAGGVEFHVQSLARELAALGHSVHVYTLGPDTGTRRDGAVVVTTLTERWRIGDTLGFPPLGSTRRLARALRDERVDIVSVHTRFFPVTAIGVRAARRARVVVVHTEHGSGHVVTDSPLIRVASRLVDLTVGRWVLRRADRVLAVSESVAAFVMRLASVEARVFYNAIDVSTADDPVRIHDVNRVVFVGRLVPGKGWDVFLEAVAALRTLGVAVAADVVGDGPDMPDLQRAIGRLGLKDVVVVHGRVSQPAVRATLRGATLVNPTILAEGFQTTLLESIAESGRVVTFDVPGAKTLQDRGAPIRVTSNADSNELLDVLRDTVGTEWVPASDALIADWLWPTRAHEYAEICRAALEATAVPTR